MAEPTVLSNDVRAVWNPNSRAPEANKPDSLVGHTIAGKYRMDSKLGAGGMGTVYRATRLLIGDSVAVKLLHPEQVADTQAVERFRREAQAAARLKHHNAVTIYDFGVSDDGLVYLVMELVEGRSLRDIINQQGPLTPTAAAEIFNQACAALDEAHRHNIIHRDVKPDNIMINTTANGLSVKVLDFGIAKLRDLATTASSLTQTGSVVGTPHYMSPEQCLGEELDHRSDIYSLGVVLYEALTGILPFNSPTSAAVVVQQVTQPPPPLRSINMSVSPSVEAVVLRALEKPRNARPQTAGALAQELSAAVQSGTVSPPQTRANLSAATPIPLTGGVAPGLAPTMQMSIPKSSGSVTPMGGGEREYLGKSKIAVLVIGAVVLVAGGATVGLLSRPQSKSDQVHDSNTQKQENSNAEKAGQRPTQTPILQDLQIEDSEIKELLVGWKQAWESRSLQSYSNYYDESFSGRNYSSQRGYQLMTRTQWTKDKEQKFRRSSAISITIGPMTTSYDGNVAIVSFAQAYQSGSYTDRGDKTLYLRKKPSGEIRIVREDFVPAKSTR